MLNCKHPWEALSLCLEYGEKYEQCQLCGHIVTSRIIKDARSEAIKSYRKADEMLVREIRISELNGLLRHIGGSFIPVDLIKARRTKLKKELKAERLRHEAELSDEQHASRKLVQPEPNGMLKEE